MLNVRDICGYCSCAVRVQVYGMRCALVADWKYVVQVECPVWDRPHQR